MPGSVKLRDVRRDPRIAVHSPTIEPPAGNPRAWPGDAKLAGTLVETAPPADDPHVGAGFFKLDITEVVLTHGHARRSPRDRVVAPRAGLAQPHPSVIAPLSRKAFPPSGPGDRPAGYRKPA